MEDNKNMKRTSDKKTKIVCTLGPSSRDTDIIREMLLSGMNVARFNFSHGTHEEHRTAIEHFRMVRDELDIPAAVLLDTKGPEVRLGDFANGRVELKAGDEFILTVAHCSGDNKRAGVSYNQLNSKVSKDTVILVDDGRIRLQVTEIKGDDIICNVIAGGIVSNRKGVNIPGKSLGLEYISEADRSDILFGIEMDVDYIAASFVRSADDVIALRTLLKQNGGDSIKIISKIENMEGIDNFDDILQVSDGIMVARGDMGVEVDFETLPGIQKRFISKCCTSGKAVITATQMLESMTSNPSPTRAEITDVANAVYDGTSAVMLSGESAAGNYPVDAVKTMCKIVKQAEDDLSYIENNHSQNIKSNKNDIANAIGHAACTTAHDINAKAIIAVTTSGYTAEMMAKYRPSEPIIAATPLKKTYHQQSLTHGVVPILTEFSSEWGTVMDAALNGAEKLNLVEKGDVVVFSAGMPLQVSGTTNLIRVATVK